MFGPNKCPRVEIDSNTHLNSANPLKNESEMAKELDFALFSPYQLH